MQKFVLLKLLGELFEKITYFKVAFNRTIFFIVHILKTTEVVSEHYLVSSRCG